MLVGVVVEDGDDAAALVVVVVMVGVEGAGVVATGGMGRSGG